MRFSIVFASFFLLAQRATSHFILQYPHSLGFGDDIESEAPCGGFPVKFNASDDSIPVGGFPVSMLSVHPASEWLFKATLDQEAPFNWTNLLPVVDETGIGQFCLPHLKAPESFAGHPGLVQVIQQSPDGTLYQVHTLSFSGILWALPSSFVFFLFSFSAYA